MYGSLARNWVTTNPSRISSHTDCAVCKEPSLELAARDVVVRELFVLALEAHGESLAFVLPCVGGQHERAGLLQLFREDADVRARARKADSCKAKRKTIVCTINHQPAPSNDTTTSATPLSWSRGVATVANTATRQHARSAVHRFHVQKMQLCTQRTAIAADRSTHRRPSLQVGPAKAVAVWLLGI